LLINIKSNKFVYTSILEDSALIRIIDSSGNILKQKAYTWNRWAIPESIIEIQNGDLLLIGECADNPPLLRGVYALRTDSLLNAKPPIWIDPSISQVRKKFSLKQNYPNPFNGQTYIEFELPIKTEIKIKIIDLLGREIETVTKGVYDAGVYNLTYNADKLASGIYFVSLFTNDKLVLTRKIVYLK
jgi:hypothetical protein